jgi:hypothetical protein
MEAARVANDLVFPSEVAFANAKCGWMVNSAQPANGALAAGPNVRPIYYRWWRHLEEAGHQGIAPGNDPEAVQIIGSIVLHTTDGGHAWMK